MKTKKTKKRKMKKLHYPWEEAEGKNRPMAKEGFESLLPKKLKGEEGKERCPFCKAEYKGSLLKHIEDCPNVIRFKV